MTAERLAAWSQEMREVHRRLREALRLARESVTEEPTLDLSASPLLYCWGFCAALSGHHGSEDGALFPLVVEAHPDLAPVVAPAHPGPSHDRVPDRRTAADDRAGRPDG